MGVPALSAAIKLAPNDTNLRGRLCAALLREGRLREAEEQLDICLALCPSNSRKRLFLAVLRGRLRVALRRRDLLRNDGLLR